MTELMLILKNILLPIFIVMFIGYILQIKFKLDLNTLAKLNIYLLVPGFIFVKLYETHFIGKLFFYIIIFFLIYMFFLFLISYILAKVLKYDKAKGTTLTNSVLFFNSGNYGVPVNDLVFKGDPLAMSVQVIILTMQNIFTFTYGIFSLQSLQVGKLKALLGYFKMPIIYALLAGVLLNYYEISVPQFIWTPMNYIAEAMIALALVLLGAQIARIKFKFEWSSSYLYIILRLVIGPIIALIIIKLMNIEGVIGQALFIASAMPASVNSSVIAQEYNNYPELAAQMVFLSTLFSTLTVTVVIYLSKILF